MKPKGWVAFVLGILLTLMGIVGLAVYRSGLAAMIPLLIGIGLVFLGWRGGRHGLAVFGHSCIVVGCFMVAWGVYLIPYSQPTFVGVLSRPLFWGLFSIGGGVCANYHGFCKCVRGLD